MGDDNKSGWERLANELKNPWDWAAAFIGGAGGAGATILTHGLDLGHSIPTGALGAVGARRAAVAGFRGRGLRKRSEALEKIFERDGDDDFLKILKDRREKWQLKVITNDQFEKDLDVLSDQHSARIAAPLNFLQAAQASPPPPRL